MVYGSGLILQVIAIVVSVRAGNDPYLLITAISGITGVISVVLCAQGKLSQYIFGYIQLFTYLFGVAIPLALWGEVIENLFYAATMVVGIIIWVKRYDNKKIRSRAITRKGWVIVLVSLCIMVEVVSYLLPQLTIWFPAVFSQTDPLPLLDSITTVVPLYGQMLMVFGYSDQWIFWFIEDVVSLIMFALMGNYIMVAQYVFWTVNCIYGYVSWRKLEQGE